MPSNSGYGNGGSFTNVTSGPSGMDVSRYLQALLGAEQKFMGQKAQAQVAPRRTAGFGAGTLHRGNGGARAGGGEGKSGVDAMKQRLLAAQVGQAEAEAAAAQLPAPLRMVSGPGVVPGYTMDTLAMSGAQRQAYLPGGNSQIGGFGQAPSPSELAFQDRLQAERELSRFGEGFTSLSGAPGAQVQRFGGPRGR